MKWILLLQKLIFTSSIFCFSSLSFSQSDTTFSETITHKNSGGPDTVIIERIKVKKEKIYYVKRDTILQVDTVLKIQTDTVLKTKTVVVYKKRKPHFTLGFSAGSSFDYDHTHYWDTHTTYYESQKQNTNEKLNWNTELFITFQRKKWLFQFNSGLINFRDQLSNISAINKLTYLTFSAVPSLKVLDKKWGYLSAGAGTGFKSLLSQEGTYINPSNITDYSEDNLFFPTNKNLWFLTARLEAKIKVSEHVSFYPQLRYETHPTSITTVNHPVLHWRDLVGVNLSVGWDF